LLLVEGGLVLSKLLGGLFLGIFGIFFIRMVHKMEIRYAYNLQTWEAIAADPTGKLPGARVQFSIT
jgi:hypothetical protein